MCIHQMKECKQSVIKKLNQLRKSDKYDMWQFYFGPLLLAL